MYQVARFFFSAWAVAFVAGCSADPEVVVIEGDAFGTTYRVAIVDESGSVDPAALKPVIDRSIEETNALFSNWQDNSEVSAFNRAAANAPIAVSPAFQELILTADVIHDASAGQFDITVGPLIELWGFGARGPEAAVPSAEKIAAAQASVGQSRMLALDPVRGTLTKKSSETTIYLAAIAKGSGIDALARALEQQGFDDFMVEVGGDLFAVGDGPTRQGWRIGVESPVPFSRQIQRVVAVNGQGMATSGDYRNFFEEDGTRYSHIIDAVTGRPVTHRTASVTVLAENAALADAWATALLALGAERGLQIAEDQKLAALFIVRHEDSAKGEFRQVTTSAFESLLR
ncbi:MAG: FAD:protein FMN transferase [Pseudomonadota bacterium]